jgi:hypothetical protein
MESFGGMFFMRAFCDNDIDENEKQIDESHLEPFRSFESQEVNRSKLVLVVDH